MLKRYLICFLVVLLFSAQLGFSQSKEQVYAGVIFHIMKYVEWPEVGNTMTVGVLNDNQLTAALNKVAAGKKIVFKNIEVVKFSDLSKLKNTNVLFLHSIALGCNKPLLFFQPHYPQDVKGDNHSNNDGYNRKENVRVTDGSE